MPTDRLVLGALLVVSMSACGSGEPTPSSTPGETTSGPTAADVCPTLDLRTRSGSRLELTGTWRADTPATATQPGAVAGPIVRYVRQFGECVWWEEMDDAEPGEVPGQVYRRLFFGSLRPDFTIVGQFGEVYTARGAFDPSGESRTPLFGSTVWRVVVTTSGDVELITLVGPSRDSDSLTGAFDTWVFSRTAADTEAH